MIYFYTRIYFCSLCAHIAHINIQTNMHQHSESRHVATCGVSHYMTTFYAPFHIMNANTATHMGSIFSIRSNNSSPNWNILFGVRFWIIIFGCFFLLEDQTKLRANIIMCRSCDCCAHQSSFWGDVRSQLPDWSIQITTVIPFSYIVNLNIFGSRTAYNSLWNTRMCTKSNQIQYRAQKHARVKESIVHGLEACEAFETESFHTNLI